MDEDTPLSVTLPMKRWKVVLTGLLELPGKVALPTYQDVMNQTQTQVDMLNATKRDHTHEQATEARRT